VETTIDEVDAESSLDVAQADAADAQRPDGGARSAERRGGHVGRPYWDGKAGTLGKVDALRRQDCRRCRDRRTRIERLHLANDRIRLGSVIRGT
jgi:hypothetical protein